MKKQILFGLIASFIFLSVAGGPFAQEITGTSSVSISPSPQRNAVKQGKLQQIKQYIMSLIQGDLQKLKVEYKTKINQATTQEEKDKLMEEFKAKRKELVQGVKKEAINKFRSGGILSPTPVSNNSQTTNTNFLRDFFKKIFPWVKN